MHHRGTEIEVVAEPVIEVESEQCLALGAEQRLIFKRDAYALPRIDYALIDYRHDTHRIVDRVIAVFNKTHTSGHHHNRPTRHIHGVKPYLCAVGGLIFTGKDEFVLIGKLACYDKCRVIQLLIHVTLGNDRIVNRPGKMLAKGLNHGENHLSGRREYRVAVDEVK